MYSKEQIPSGAQARFQLDGNLKKNSMGGVKSIVETLEIAARAELNMSYLAVISSVLTEFLNAYDRVDTLQAEWKLIGDHVRVTRKAVDDMRERYKGKADEELPEGLGESFEHLEKSIIRSLETLNICMNGSRGLMGRARLLLDRSTLNSDVKERRQDFVVALRMFNTAITAIYRKQQTVVIAGRFILSSSGRLALPSAAFRGRAPVLSHILKLVLHKAPARVAILGSGGIGKTETALTVLNHPDVVATYSNRRIFVSCHHVSSGQGIIFQLLTVFGLECDPQERPLSQDALLLYLRGLPNGILCLDNWSADVHTTEDLLSDLAALSNIALLVTMRGMERPKEVVWTAPFLAPLALFTLDDATRAWDAICNVNDKSAGKLMQAVDCRPLSVTLLASRARTESPRALWQRWELYRRDPSQVSSAKGRLPDMGLSIEFALRGSQERNGNAAALLLGVICWLPQGMPESRLPDFIDAFSETIPDLRACVGSLKQYSLVYSSEDAFLRALSPVARFMQSYHPLPDPVHAQLTDIYLKTVEPDFKPDFNARAAYTRKHVRDEVGNIVAILLHAVENEKSTGPLERCLRAIVSFSRLCTHIHYHGVELLSKAIVMANNNVYTMSRASVLLELLMQRSAALHSSARYSEAIPAFTQILEVCRLGQNDATEVATRPEAWNLVLLGDAYHQYGQYEEARRILHSALAFYEKDMENVTGAMALCQVQLGSVYQDLGMLNKAEGLLRSAHQSFSTLVAEHKTGPASSSSALGDLHLSTYEFGSAETELLFSLKIFEETAYEADLAGSLLSLGCLYMQTSRLESAKERFESAKELYVAAGSRRGVAGCHWGLGALHIQLNKLAVAEEHLQSALELHAKVEYPKGKVTVLNDLGTLYRLLGRFDEAHAALDSAIELSNGMPYPIGEGDAQFCLGRVHKDRGELQLALSCFERARELFEQAQDPHRAKSVQENLNGIATLLQASGEVSSSEK
ncbi:TPR-like protein [Peniophora sp. CONT]|nr:TPR-like protein [Peniophora sp. CONT]